MKTKTTLAIFSLMSLLSFGAASAKDMNATTTVGNQAATSHHEEEAPTYLKAVRLINLPNGDCAFEYGKLETKVHMPATSFFAQTKVDAYEKVAHPAPRMQYVVTLKGKLQFKVTNGDTFIIEPGTILIAEDVKGKGHTWDLLDGDKWDRLYIPIPAGADDHFIADKK